jgi:fibronectin type 3 domain-containing protein
VVFTPAASGPRSGTLVVTDNSNGVAGSTQTASLTGTGAHDVVLNWDPSPTSGVLGYDIYRGTTSEGESTTPIATEIATGCTMLATCAYVDTAVVAGTTYYYYVTAVASNGTTQSADSNEASARVPSP